MNGNTLIAEELKVKDATFEYSNDDVMALELAVQFGPDKDKSTKSTVSFCTGNIGGYPMKILLQPTWGGEYVPERPIEVDAVTIQFTGSYERDILIAAMQKIGLMTMPTYGRIEYGPFEPHEE